MAEGEINPKVMAVDDDAFMVGTLLHLVQTKFPFTYAQSGEEALRMLKNGEHPDIIILDMNMPGIDGFEVLKHIRENPETANIPVVMLSAFAQDKDAELIKKLGVRRFIDKAETTPQKMVEIVEEECKKH